MSREFKTKTNPRAFTLVELVISTTIFTIIIGVAFTLFISISRIQRKTMVAQRLAGEGRYLMEVMARTIREGRVSYTYWDGTPISYLSPPNNDFIYVEDMQGYSNLFYQDNADIKKESKNAMGVVLPYIVLNSANFKINSLRFYITPNQSPGVNKPIVLITLSAENAETDASIKDTIYLQTAVESRYY